MTKKLVWKLKEAPTAEGVARLVEQKVITPEEARDMVARDFDSKEADEAKDAELEFLRKLVDKLLAKIDQHSYTTIYRDVWKPRYDRYEPIWCTTTSTSLPNYTVFMSTNSVTNKQAADIRGDIIC